MVVVVILLRTAETSKTKKETSNQTYLMAELNLPQFLRDLKSDRMPQLLRDLKSDWTNQNKVPSSVVVVLVVVPLEKAESSKMQKRRLQI